MRAATRWSRAAAVVLAALAVKHLLVAAAQPGYVRVLTLALAGAGLLVMVRLATHNCPEARAAAVLVAGLSASGAVLALTVGLPGQPATRGAGPVLGQLATLALAALVTLLVALDRAPRTAVTSKAAPYAL